MRPILKTLPFLLISVLSFSSCSGWRRGNGNVLKGEFEDHLTKQDDYLADFSKGFSSNFYLRNDYNGNGHPFNCAFLNTNANVDNGVLNLMLTKEGNRYVGAEIRSQKYYGYGFYSVSMKPAKCSGVISSFFTYVGYPSWHEIDIEFLGNDTTMVQFNYYTNGIGGHEYFYNLGFDASEEFHEYGFSWNKDSLVYYVDGKAVYKTYTEIPQQSGRIMMNLWNVDDSKKEWAGKFDDSKLPLVASYEWVGYQTF